MRVGSKQRRAQDQLALDDVTGSQPGRRSEKAKACGSRDLREFDVNLSDVRVCQLSVRDSDFVIPFGSLSENFDISSSAAVLDRKELGGKPPCISSLSYSVETAGAMVRFLRLEGQYVNKLGEDEWSLSTYQDLLKQFQKETDEHNIYANY